MTIPHLVNRIHVEPKATLGERASLFAATKLWNAPPRLIRKSISNDTFKRKLKARLFKLEIVSTRAAPVFDNFFMDLY